jgi:protein MpaA
MKRSTFFTITTIAAILPIVLAGCKNPTATKPAKSNIAQLPTKEIDPEKLIENQLATKQELLKQQRATKAKKSFCSRVNKTFRKFHWNAIVCNPNTWKVHDYTAKGRPLMYQEFGFTPNNKKPITLFMCGVHGDEGTGIYLCFHLAREILFDRPNILKEFRVILAPIVNPDGYLAGTRTNSRGVDPNRNLPTKDFKSMAMKVWSKYKKDPRKYPGKSAASEKESQFQVYLINKFTPDKIVSVHAPYGFLDYDGPGDRKYYNLVRVEQRAKYLALNIQANSNKFLKVVDFRFFPGSLGNYAGNERKIPTYTLELPSVKTSKANYYWDKLKFALTKALAFSVYDNAGGNPFAKSKPLMQDTEVKKPIKSSINAKAPKTGKKSNETTTN